MAGSELHGGWCADPDVLPVEVCEFLNCCMYEGLERSGTIPADYGDVGNEPWFLVL